MKHNSEYRHKAFWTKDITFSTSLPKPPDLFQAFGPHPLKSVVKHILFNIFSFQPHQAPPYTHFACSLSSLGPSFLFPAMFFHKSYEDVHPADAWSTIQNIDTKPFSWKATLFDVKMTPTPPDSSRPKQILLQPFRFAASSNPLIYSLHLPSRLSRLDFSFSGRSWLLWKCAPRHRRKHNSEYRHKAA